jgi:hypothetical protein
MRDVSCAIGATGASVQTPIRGRPILRPGSVSAALSRLFRSSVPGAHAAPLRSASRWSSPARDRPLRFAQHAGGVARPARKRSARVVGHQRARAGEQRCRFLLGAGNGGRHHLKQHQQQDARGRCHDERGGGGHGSGSHASILASSKENQMEKKAAEFLRLVPSKKILRLGRLHMSVERITSLQICAGEIIASVVRPRTEPEFIVRIASGSETRRRIFGRESTHVKNWTCNGKCKIPIWAQEMDRYSQN